jgi:hypothetical protein
LDAELRVGVNMMVGFFGGFSLGSLKFGRE